DALGIKQHVLRYWEQQFALLKPLKRSGGRRYYRASDIEMVEEINRLVNNEGYTLKGAEAVLRSRGPSAPDGANRRQGDDRRSGDRRATGEEQAVQLDSMKPAEPDYSQTVAKLKDLRDRLSKAIEA
ncbi:MAG: MerR family transcriptional regulator, partial [Erythrobacter sp.]|nr:MerR family transcriptional regulator [Erythrobacter sp.]